MTTVLDTPDQITAWVLLSRIHQLALEITTGLKSGRMPILTAMHYEGWLAQPMRGTKKNKRIVLRAAIEMYKLHVREDYEAGPSVLAALEED